MKNFFIVNHGRGEFSLWSQCPNFRRVEWVGDFRHPFDVGDAILGDIGASLEHRVNFISDWFRGGPVPQEISADQLRAWFASYEVTI